MSLLTNSSTIILFVLLALLSQVAESTGTTRLKKIIEHEDQTEVNKLRPHTFDDFSGTAEGETNRQAYTHPPTEKHEMDPSVQIFFKLSELKPGKTIPIYFPKRDASATSHFLPRKDADFMPFKTTDIPHLLDLFSFSKDSPQAKAIEFTIKQCEFEPLEGEIKFCATSLESLLELAHKTFGKKKVKVMTTTFLTKSNTRFQNYTVLKDPKEVITDKVLGCHTMPYPYAVFYCHGQMGGNRLFEVSLAGEDGDKLEAVGICHMDTSQWDPDHYAFQVLGTKPGEAPVCHFFPADNLVWVPSAT